VKPENHFSRSVVEDQLQKVLGSKGFAQSPRMSRFLRFTVERALAGESDQLKEYVLGVEVFDRKSPSYDPRVDPIVRVEARRLRSKLTSYYAGEGVADRVIIEFPTGTYAPRFRERSEAPSPDTPRPRSIAVLPFSNLGAEPDTEYFSDGLTEELIHGLTKLDGLIVVAWNSAARLKGQPYDVRGIGLQLNVASVLMGSVRRSTERLRVTAQLIDTASGRYLWSETYDRRIEDLFAIEEEISSAIVTTLRIKLMDPRKAPAIRTGAHNLEAYNLFLKGRFHWNKRTADGLKRALDYAQQAIAVDPSFAPGYVGVADSYILLAEYGLMSPASAFPPARSAAQKALEIDPALGEAHASLGLIRSHYDWEWRDAERDYRRALDLNPGYATAHRWFAIDYLTLLGRFEEAMKEIEVAQQLDPLSPIIPDGKGYLLMVSERHEQAIAEYRRILEFDGFFYNTFTSMGRAYTQMGRYDDAIGMLLKGKLLSGDVPSILGALGQTYALAGRTEEARRVLDELDGLSRGRYVPATCYALIHIGLGEQERALDWLEAGVQQRESALAALKVDPAYNPLRGEPRFQGLLRTIGLAPAALSETH
jgi:TolB-like protein/Flp pilus assembly protein TadD